MKRFCGCLLLTLLLATLCALAEDMPALPNIPAAEEPRLAEVANVPGGTLVFTNPVDAAIWPMIPAEEDGYACLTSTNWGVDSSASAVYVQVEAQAGDALSFVVKTSLETGYDRLQVKVNGEVAKVFTGEGDWRTWALAFPEAGAYEVAFVCVKDFASSEGSDAVWIRDVQLLRGDAAAAALAANPAYPVGTTRSLTVQTPGARAIVFDDPTFALTMVNGLAGYYIVPAAEVTLLATLAPGDDPDGALLGLAEEADVMVLADCWTGAGFTRTVTMEAGVTRATLMPYADCGSFEMSRVLCFPDAAAVDAYVRMLRESGYLINGWSEVGQTTCQLTVIDQHGEFLEDVTLRVTTGEGIEVLRSDANGTVTFTLPDGQNAEVCILGAPAGLGFDEGRTWVLDAAHPMAILDLTRAGE